jgi:hypothetical protein
MPGRSPRPPSPCDARPQCSWCIRNSPSSYTRGSPSASIAQESPHPSPKAPSAAGAACSRLSWTSSSAVLYLRCRPLAEHPRDEFLGDRVLLADVQPDARSSNSATPLGVPTEAAGRDAAPTNEGAGETCGFAVAQTFCNKVDRQCRTEKQIDGTRLANLVAELAVRRALLVEASPERSLGIPEAAGYF